MLISQIIFLCF